MKIVIAGGTGQIGRLLTREFLADKHDIVVLSRKPVDGEARPMLWDGRSAGAWHKEIDGADVVINLAGRSVDCRYHAKNRRDILESRVDSTRSIGAAIASVRRPPRLWLQASTATIYAHRFDAPNDEISGIIGGQEPDVPETWRFSIDVATAWERELDAAVTPQTRKVAMRSAMTMSPDAGGVFDVLLRLVRLRLGGRAGGGDQFVSWIHETDFVRAVKWLILNEQVDGPVNLSSPNPLPHADFMRSIREAWGIRFGLPATNWMLEVGAAFLRTETELILKSRRVIPGRLQAEGFSFQFPDWSAAARDLCEQWRTAKSS